MGGLFESLSKANQQWMEQWVKHLQPATPPQFDHTMMQDVMGSMFKNGNQLFEMQNEYTKQHLALWFGLMQGQPQPVVTPEKTDRRFNAEEWQKYPFFDYIKQYYLLTSKWMHDLVDQTDLDAEQKERIAFYTKQYIDAVSPSNFFLTNPEVIKLAMETNGESLVQGLKNMREDMDKGRISMTDEKQFEVGVNLAVTPGAVVFENELIQVLQYQPETAQVYRRPLLIVPPCINKYYLMDMQPENSFVRYAVSQGYTTFLISWRNIPEELKHLTWDDYLNLGVFRAIETVKAITGEPQINALGFCIGGTLLTTALAVLKARGDQSVTSMTHLTTMIDHSDPGDIKHLFDWNLVKQREAKISEGGIVSGKELAFCFSSLRANDLIWNYVVNNYLKGKTPMAFDLLYWNSDSTNLPLPMHTYYLRNMYLDNHLKVPGAMTLCGVPVDVTAIDVPSYLFAAREDHIVPWSTAYTSTQILSGDKTFVLGASGHIAGPMNPASANKRNYWVNSALPAQAEAWFEGAESRPGSWWPHWSQWLAARSLEQIPAPKTLGSKQFPVLEAAPGRYVRERVV